jgi:hypothetical protein
LISSSSSLSWLGTRQNNNKPLEELEDIKEVYNYSDVYQVRKVKRLKISKRFRITLTCTKPGK